MRSSHLVDMDWRTWSFGEFDREVVRLEPGVEALEFLNAQRDLVRSSKGPPGSGVRPRQAADAVLHTHTRIRCVLPPG